MAVTIVSRVFVTFSTYAGVSLSAFVITLRPCRIHLTRFLCWVLALKYLGVINLLYNIKSNIEVISYVKLMDVYILQQTWALIAWQMPEPRYAAQHPGSKIVKPN